MESYSLPCDFLPAEALAEPTFMMRYHADAGSTKVKVALQQNLFSFLLKGEKRVDYMGAGTTIGTDAFLLLASGHCLMSEKMAAAQGRYESILFFFDDTALADFFMRYPADGQLQAAPEAPFLVFQKDAFLANFITSVELLLSSGRKISREMQQVKLEELLVYIGHHWPERLLALRRHLDLPDEDTVVRVAAEAHAGRQITVAQLAFLCHMSLSTFKRRFFKLYGTSPNKWLLQQRMDRAALLLQQGISVSAVYDQVGYENLSSFVQSFRQAYGVTPRQYQVQKMNV